VLNFEIQIQVYIRNYVFHTQIHNQRKLPLLYNRRIDNDLYSSPNIVRVIKSRRMRWVGHVARMGGGEVYTGFWWGHMRVRDQLGDPGVDGRIILSWIYR